MILAYLATSIRFRDEIFLFVCSFLVLENLVVGGFLTANLKRLKFVEKNERIVRRDTQFLQLIADHFTVLFVFFDAQSSDRVD